MNAPVLLNCLPANLRERAEDGDAPDGLPPGYSLRDDGVYRRIEGSDGTSHWVRLCSPLRVLALPRGGDGRGWGRLIQVIDDDGQPHLWAMPMEMLAGDGAEMRRALMNRGLTIAGDKGARAALTKLLMDWKPARRVRTTDHLGWVDSNCVAFVLGDGRVIGDDNVVYQSETALDSPAAKWASGTLSDWRQQVAAPCANNPLLVFAMSCGFAGPLLEPLGQESGGVHFRGSSSCGKSTSQRAAVSIWGGAESMRTWRATSNGLEGVAAASNSSILVLDELGQVDGREAGAVAYMLGNGSGKARANREGGARASARWRLLYLSSGEISLADKMAEAGKLLKAGQEVRLLDIAADTRSHGLFDDLHGAETAAVFADKLSAGATRFYGTAGPAFVAALLQDLDSTRNQVKAVMQQFETEARKRVRLEGNDGQVARALKRFAMIAAAGELASAMGLTGWPSGEARRAALVALEVWLNGRGGAGDYETRDAIRRTRAFLIAHESRFEALGADADSTPPVHNRAGWKDTGMFYVAADVWREIHAGADATRAAKALERANLLQRGEGRNLQTRITTAKGRPRAYAVRVAILGVEDDGSGYA